MEGCGSRADIAGNSGSDMWREWCCSCMLLLLLKTKQWLWHWRHLLRRKWVCVMLLLLLMLLRLLRSEAYTRRGAGKDTLWLLLRMLLLLLRKRLWAVNRLTLSKGGWMDHVANVV